MCSACWPRRGVLAAAMGLAARAAQAEGRPVEPLMRLPPGEGFRVALTFDACPGLFDARVAQAVVAAGAPASVFLTALWMRRNPEGLAYLLAHPDIFTLENHGARHLAPVLGDRPIFGVAVAGDLAAIGREVREGAAAVAAARGRAPGFYRAATGFYSPSVIPAIEAMGCAIGGYTFSADAGASLPAASVAARYAAARPGDVIVAHINQPHRASGAGVAAGLAALRARGARFMKLEEMVRI